MGHEDSSWVNLNIHDSAKYLEINNSAVQKSMVENDADTTGASMDSVYTTELFVVMDGNTLFQQKYTLKTSEATHTFKLYAVSGSDSTLLDKSYTIASTKKLEEIAGLNVSPLIKDESIFVGFFRALKPYAVFFSVLLCVLEVVLGFAILIGWKPKLILWTTLITIVFFSFLTWYSAVFNKVTDCGCFGDFIKLEPWTSFFKDLVLLILILFLFIRRKHIVPLFSKWFSINAMCIFTLMSISFAVYCNSYLPVWDFLPYEVGNNIKTMMTAPAGQRNSDSVQMVFIYEKDGVKKSFMLNALPKSEEGWKYVDRKDSIIIKAWKSNIHDFDFGKRDEKDVNIKDSILNGHGYQLLIISTELNKSNEDAWEDIRLMATDAKANGIQVYAATSSMLEEADAFSNEMQLPFKFNNADQTLLKTMMRSNPGVYFFKNGTVLGKWSSRNIPKIKKLQKLMTK
ncbi:MAG: BT_3928 family protein [Bacteroidota bacterium]